MHDNVLRDLQRRIDELERTRARVRVGVVTGTSPLAVAIGGASVPFSAVRSIEGQTYTVNDRVACLMWGGDLIALGVIV